MAPKKRTKKKSSKAKNAPERRLTKKAAQKKMTAKRKAVSKKSIVARKTSRAKKSVALKKRVRGKSQTVDTVSFEPVGLGARSGGQSGDLQGLSNIGRANSESVDELLEEGNAFEAEVVKGVEDAGDADEGEVRTHEVPQDDVPEEYRDKD
jgi:hypothetical protein